MSNLRNEIAKLAALAAITLLTNSHTRVEAETTVVLDQFSRVGELDQSAPTLGSDAWSNPGIDWLTTSEQAFLETPGPESRANYPVQLADGEVHTFTIDVDVVDDKGMDWAAVGFAWNIDSNSADTGVGPWLYLRSEDSDFDMASFTFSGSGRREHNFGEGSLQGVDFTNTGTIGILIDARGATDTVQFSFNGISLGDPQTMLPNGLSNIDGVFISGTSQAFVDNAQLVSVPEPSALALVMIGLLSRRDVYEAAGVSHQQASVATHSFRF